MNGPRSRADRPRGGGWCLLALAVVVGAAALVVNGVRLWLNGA
jgi:hypothetical protein